MASGQRDTLLADVQDLRARMDALQRRIHALEKRVERT
jgi:hypothetical protein